MKNIITLLAICIGIILPAHAQQTQGKSNEITIGNSKTEYPDIFFVDSLDGYFLQYGKTINDNNQLIFGYSNSSGEKESENEYYRGLNKQQGESVAIAFEHYSPLNQSDSVKLYLSPAIGYGEQTTTTTIEYQKLPEIQIIESNNVSYTEATALNVGLAFYPIKALEITASLYYQNSNSTDNNNGYKSESGIYVTGDNLHIEYTTTGESKIFVDYYRYGYDDNNDSSNTNVGFSLALTQNVAINFEYEVTSHNVIDGDIYDTTVGTSIKF